MCIGSAGLWLVPTKLSSTSVLYRRLLLTLPWNFCCINITWLQQQRVVGLAFLLLCFMQRSFLRFANYTRPAAAAATAASDHIWRSVYRKEMIIKVNSYIHQKRKNVLLLAHCHIIYINKVCKLKLFIVRETKRCCQNLKCAYL